MDDRLPFSEGPPILYDCEMFVRAKNDVAAASILGNLGATCPSVLYSVRVSGVRDPRYVMSCRCEVMRRGTE